MSKIFETSENPVLDVVIKENKVKFSISMDNTQEPAITLIMTAIAAKNLAIELMNAAYMLNNKVRLDKVG